MGSTAIGSAPSRVSTCGSVATGLPIASTPVASRSPVTQFVFLVDRFEEACCAHAAADAHRHNRALAAAALQYVLACETSVACNDFEGCNEQYERFNTLCF